MPLKEPTELFHYTRIAGLRGILESQTLWATHYLYLNDANEIRQLRRVLESFLLPAAKKVKLLEGETTPEKIVENFVTGMYSACLGDEEDPALAEPYITSFCSTDDKNEARHGLLSQWRGYGRDGGYAIVFDVPVLKSLLEEESKKWLYSFLRAKDVVYSDASEEEVREKIRPHLKTIKDVFIKFRQTLKQELLEKTFDPFLVAACRYKHWGFKEEKEFRIVAIPSSSQAVKNLRRQSCRSLREKPKGHFLRAGTAVPYIDLFERITSPRAKPLPIKRIIVGPHQEKERRKSAIEILLKKLGIDAEVSVSEIPYLGQ